MRLDWIKPGDIRLHWETIKPGLKKIEATTDAWIVEDIYLALRTNACTLHIGYEEEYVGFIITQKQDNYGVVGIHVWAAYSEAHDFNILEAAVTHLHDWAHNVEAKKITFSSTRKGWMRQAQKLGFKQSPLITYELRL